MFEVIYAVKPAGFVFFFLGGGRSDLGVKVWRVSFLRPFEPKRNLFKGLVF